MTKRAPTLARASRLDDDRLVFIHDKPKWV